MRTTLTIDPDIAAKAKRAMRQTGLPFKTLINNALRVGLDQVLSPASSRPYTTHPTPMRLRPGLSYDNVSDLLDYGEGEHRR